jgi:uncharacterized membrane protein YbhN (UPF0104 family)
VSIAALPVRAADSAPRLDSAGLAITPVLRRRRLSRRTGWWVTALLFATALLLLGTPIADGDTVSDLWGSASASARNLGRMPWPIAPVLVIVAGFHYVAAAIALRAASGLRLPLREATWVQLAAAAANRLTPAGLGGATVNARYLRRRNVGTSQALATVGVLGALGAGADMLVFAGLVGAGQWVGISGGSHELAALGAKLSGPWHTVSRLPWPVLAAIAMAIAGGGAEALRRSRQRRHQAGQEANASSPKAAWTLLTDLLRQPRRFATLLAASGATTLLLAAAFSITALAASPSSKLSFGGLLMGYLIGGAVGTAVPTPAGVGSTEAALIAVLLVAHVPTATAISSVLLFRLVTFWTPAVVGLVAVRSLRRRALL